MMTPERTHSSDSLDDEPMGGCPSPVPMMKTIPMMHVGDLENQRLLNDDTTLGVSVNEGDVSGTINNTINDSMTSENCKIIDESDTQHSPCPDPDGDMHMNRVTRNGSGVVPDSANVTPIKLEAGWKEQDNTNTSPAPTSPANSHEDKDSFDEENDELDDSSPLSRRQQRMRIVKCYGMVAIIVLLCAIGLPLGAIMLFDTQNNETSFTGAEDSTNDPSTTTTGTDVMPPPMDESTQAPFFDEKTSPPEWVKDEDGDTDAPEFWEEENTEEPEEEIVVTDPPVITTDAPVIITTDPPVITTDAPVITTDAPVNVTDAPAEANLTVTTFGERNVTSDADTGFQPEDLSELSEEPSEDPTGNPTTEGSTTDAPTTSPTSAATNAPTIRATLPPVLSTPAPTVPATPGPDRSIVYFELVNVTSPAVLQDTTTPQALSYLWLVEQDQVLPVPEGRKLIQRYALVVMDHVFHNPVQPLLSIPNLDECEWTGIVCDEAGEVTQINWLRQGLNGGLVAEMQLLTSLERLDLSENELTGPLEPLYQATNLKHVYLHDNKFTGTLSEQVGLLTELESLFLGHNELTGQLPISLRSPRGTGKPLKWLILSHNKFSGYLPPDWRLRNLFHLDLGHNLFSGPLPNDWDRNMVRLRSLYLDNNAFTGTIPQNFPQIGNGRMKAMHIDNNFLEGSLPTGWDPVDQLTSFSAHNNNLTEPIDSAFCQLSVFELGVMVEMRVDCPICTCDMLCGSCQ